jgi:geranylgeranylglycerol-phosphate geranylgeranyltransferase
MQWQDAVEISRLNNLILAGLTVPLGAHIAIDGLWSYGLGLDVLLAMLSVMAFMAAGNTFNDIADSAIDKEAHPERVIPSGRMTIHEAKRLGQVFSLLSFIFLAILSWRTSYWPIIAIWAFAAILMITYDHGLQTKKSGLFGNISISLMVGAVILFGAAAVRSMDSQLIWYAAGVAMLANLAREIIKDCEDMESDEDRNTLPRRIGLAKSRNIAFVIVCLSLILLYLPHWLGPLKFWQLLLQTPAIMMLITLSNPLLKGEYYSAQQRIRMAMLLGLISFAVAVSL